MGWWRGKVCSYYALFHFSLVLNVYYVFFSFSLIATIKQARSDLLTDKAVVSAPISPEIPPGFLDEQKDIIEDIGEASTACFLTKSHIDQTNWYRPQVFSPSVPFLKAFKRSGGCLRNMMVSEGSGIQRKESSFQGKAQSFSCRRTSSMQCLTTYSWMASCGMSTHVIGSILLLLIEKQVWKRKFSGVYEDKQQSTNISHRLEQIQIHGIRYTESPRHIRGTV